MDDPVEKKVKQTAREATERVQESSSKAAEGLRDCQTKMIAAAKANVNAMFDYAQEAIKVKSVPELVELSTTYSQRQLEMMAEQARDITGAAQKVVTESARPLTSGVTNPFGQMS